MEFWLSCHVNSFLTYFSANIIVVVVWLLFFICKWHNRNITSTISGRFRDRGEARYIGKIKSIVCILLKTQQKDKHKLNLCIQERYKLKSSLFIQQLQSMWKAYWKLTIFYIFSLENRHDFAYSSIFPLIFQQHWSFCSYQRHFNNVYPVASDQMIIICLISMHLYILR